jgi:hypothetical protein
MSWATKFQSVTQIAIVTQELGNVVPNRYALGGIAVADNIHPMLRARQEDVDPIGRSEEARHVIIVASNKRDQDN